MTDTAGRRQPVAAPRPGTGRAAREPAFWDKWARGRSDEQLANFLVECGLMVIFGGDLAGPLTPGMKRTLNTQRAAVVREQKRRTKKAST